MKKFISLILSIGFIFSFVGCSTNDNTAGSSGENPATQTLPTYSITASAEGGSIVCDKEKVTLGESLTVTLTPEVDKVLYSLTVNGGEVTAVAGAKDGVVYYTWTAPSVLENYTVKAVLAIRTLPCLSTRTAETATLPKWARCTGSRLAYCRK